jgi:hypothetical protein
MKDLRRKPTAEWTDGRDGVFLATTRKNQYITKLIQFSILVSEAADEKVKLGSMEPPNQDICFFFSESTYLFLTYHFSFLWGDFLDIPAYVELTLTLGKTRVICVYPRTLYPAGCEKKTALERGK